jgi:hypothetical protein
MGEGMFGKIKFALKVIFTTPKPKIEETEYITERKSFRKDYSKYYTKKEKFTMWIWLSTLLIMTGESMIFSIIFWNNLVRFLPLGALIFFFVIYKKNISRLKEKYKKRAIKEG